jgi:LuxR family maltose regulon positive regulatory protein
VRLAAAAGRAGVRGGYVIDVLAEVAGDELLADLVALATVDEIDAPSVAAILGLSAEDAALRLRRLVAERVFLRRGSRAGTWRFARPVLRALRQELAARPAALRDGGLPGMGSALLEDDVLAGRALELLLAGRLVAPAPDALARTGPPSLAGRTAAALALMDAGDAETARALIVPGDAGPDVDEGIALALAIAGARAAGDRPAAVATLARIRERARRGADAYAAGLEAYALLQLGRLDLAEGRVADGDEHLRLATGLAEHTGAPGVFARARIGRASLAVAAGRLSEADRLARSVPAEQARPETRARRSLVLGEIAYARADAAGAREQVTLARAAAEATRSPEIWFHVLFLDALLLDDVGDDDRAFERLAEAVAMRDCCPARLAHARTVEVLRVRLLARAGREAEADALLAELDTERDPFARPIIDLVVAQRALSRSAPDEALRRLRRWAVEETIPGLDVWHLATFALAADRVGDGDTAHIAIERALDSAACESIVRPFLDDGIRLGDLLARHAKTTTAHGAFILHLIARVGDGRPIPEGQVLRPLTGRERTILGLLPTELTAAEIADALLISEATVRTHIRNIYEKLGASSRREAVTRARELRLLNAQQT